MLICTVSDEITLRLLERRHAKAIEGLQPGDLSFAQGEWGEWTMGVEEWLERALEEFGEGTRLEAGIFKGGTLLGVIALHNIDRRQGSADVDYAMDSRYRNQGIMTEACGALVTHAFSEVGLHRLQIRVDPANLPSLRIPEKLGFTKEAVLRSYYRAGSGFRDCAVYSMVQRAHPSLVC